LDVTPTAIPLNTTTSHNAAVSLQPPTRNHGPNSDNHLLPLTIDEVLSFLSSSQINTIKSIPRSLQLPACYLAEDLLAQISRNPQDIQLHLHYHLFAPVVLCSLPRQNG
jgi:hypothetical protein